MHAQKLLLNNDTDKQVKSTNEANKIPATNGTRYKEVIVLICMYIRIDRRLIKL